MKTNKLIRAFFFSALIVFSAQAFALPLSNTWIAAGQSELGPMADITHDSGKTWSYIPSFPNQKNTLLNAVPSCSGEGDHATCVVAGLANGGTVGINFRPELAVSRDGGQQWKLQSVRGLPPYNLLWINSQSCFPKENGEPRCVITGSYDLPDGGVLQDFIATSNDQMHSWDAKPIAGFSTKDNTFVLDTPISCTGKGDQAICATFAATNQAQYMVTSQDGGKTWVANPTTAFISWMSCTGSAPNAVCVASGVDNASHNLFFVSTDNAKTWVTKTPPPAPGDGALIELAQVSCTGEGASAICVAQGMYLLEAEDQQDPILLVSQDAGNTWTYKPIPNQDNASLAWVNCSGDSIHGAVCAAVGANISPNPTDSQQEPYILVSNDSGNTWTLKYANGAAALGNFRRVTCQGDALVGACFAEGVAIPQTNIAYRNYQPLLAMSLDQGNTWTAPLPQGQPNPLQGILGGDGV